MQKKQVWLQGMSLSFGSSTLVNQEKRKLDWFLQHGFLDKELATVEAMQEAWKWHKRITDLFWSTEYHTHSYRYMIYPVCIGRQSSHEILNLLFFISSHGGRHREYALKVRSSDHQEVKPDINWIMFSK